jgi:hypothetical protein
MKNFARALLGCALGLTACASTSILSAWKEPSAIAVSFHKVAVLAPVQDQALRRATEDAMVQNLTTVRAVQSYTFMPLASDDNLFRQEVQRRGFDGVIVLRVQAVEQNATWVPGMAVGPFYAYSGWPAFDPGYIRIDTFVRVETTVYSAPDQKLLWASASRTMNPSGVYDLVKQTARAVGREMRKQGFIL